MRRPYLYFLSVLFLHVSVWADGPRFGYDVAQFKGDSGRLRVDVYVAVADTQFIYKKSTSGLMGAIDFDIVCLSGLDSIVKRRFSVESALSNTADSNRKTFVSRQSFQLKPGQYTLNFSVTDRQRPSRKEFVKVPLVIRAFSKKGLSLSDLLICQIPEVDSPRKNEISLTSVSVLPSREVCGDMPVLRTYVEVNQDIVNPVDSVSVLYSISDAVRRPILDMTHTIRVKDAIAADVYEQQVHILPSGVYYITATLLHPDGSSIPTSQVSKKFYILNPAYPPELSDLFSEDQLFLASEFATMNAESIQEEYEKAKRVGPDIELVSFQQLSTLNAKQKFLFRYWYHKDPNPSTTVNERYEDFKKAVEYAKLNFTNPFSPRGWDSDRGRVILRYGFPTNINRVIFNHDAAFPHETWEYDNIQGGVIFVFVDKRGSGNVTLVHSTALNEHRDDLWYRRYAIDPSQNK